MARMLGRWLSGGCGCKSRGPDCCGHEASTRWRKRVEARQWLAAEGLLPLPLLPAPHTDESDCRHGCNGAEVVYGHESEVCDFTCHPELALDPVRAARYDAVMAALQPGAGLG
jgi:hypothetical protein